MKMEMKKMYANNLSNEGKKEVKNKLNLPKFKRERKEQKKQTKS